MALKKDKLYYSIGEVSEHLELNASLIRFWEKEFEQLSPKKNRKGNRQFTKEDIDVLNTIKHLVKDRGFTLQGAQEKLKKDKTSVAKEVELVNSLNNIKSFLLKIKEEL
jgi:DNA-binding transcriptional MerR regulator